MTPHARCLPRFALGLVGLLVFLAGCSPRVTAPPEPPYSVRRGDEAFRYNDYEGAISSYRNYLDESQQDPDTARVFYKTALAQYRLGHYDDTLATLSELEQRYPSRNWVQVDALRGDAERELHRPMMALKAWDNGWVIASDNDRRKLRQRIVSLARELTDGQLAQAQRMVDTEAVRSLLEQQIAVRQPGINEPIPEDEGVAVAEGTAAETKPAEMKPAKAKPAEAKPAATSSFAQAKVSRDTSKPTANVEPIAVAPPPQPQENEVGDHTAPVGEKLPPIAGAGALPATEAKIEGQPKVACLLPLSGPSQEAGERSLRGLRVLFGENSARLVVMDTGDKSANAVRMFDQLSRNPDVLAVIGPLRGEDAEAVVPLARKAQVPLLLLSQRDGLAGGSVLQVGMTRSQLVDTVLQYAMGKLRMLRFGVLYPEDNFGKEYAAAFRAEVKRRGGSIVGVDGYSPQTHALPAATLKRWRDSEHLQAVFLPDNVTMAQTLAEILQRDMPDVTLLGAHGWESIAGQDNNRVNGVLFSDGFYGGSKRPWTQQFIERFQAMYRDIPGALEAQAYDAGLLAQGALLAGARSRAEVLQTLRTQGPIEGATGQFTVTPTGLQHQLFLLQVYDNRVQEVGDNSD